MQTPRTLIGASVANRLMEQLNVGHARVARHTAAGICAAARVTEAGTLVLDLDARHAFRHGRYEGLQRRHYIRSASVTDSINRAVSKLYLLKKTQAPALAAREALHDLAETREIPDTWRDDATMPHPAIGKGYTDLTIEECAQLTPLVEALPLKRAAA